MPRLLPPRVLMPSGEEARRATQILPKRARYATLIAARELAYALSRAEARVDITRVQNASMRLPRHEYDAAARVCVERKKVADVRLHAAMPRQAQCGAVAQY